MVPKRSCGTRWLPFSGSGLCRGGTPVFQSGRSKHHWSRRFPRTEAFQYAIVIKAAYGFESGKCGVAFGWQREADCLKFVKGESLGAEPHNQATAADGFAVALRITQSDRSAL